jgi:hypothetical protein
MRKQLTLLLATGLAASCSGRPAAVPVMGEPQDLSALSGEWNGTYKTTAGRVRTGHLFFNLRPGKDTAIGYVVMTYPTEPVTIDPYVYAAPVVQTEQLSIAFVRATGGRVSGQIEPYKDPWCGCQLRTSFVGRVRGDKIVGTFTTQHLETNLITWGEWQASRQAAKVIVEN